MSRKARPFPVWFAPRSVVLDDLADWFLRRLVDLGGYCTVNQARRLGVAASSTRTRAKLREMERAGFLRRVTRYPVVYQVTKSANRHVDRDSRTRRLHVLGTVQARILGVSFYLEAIRWPAEFVFDHASKIDAFAGNGCPAHLLPQRRQKPYLWEDFVLETGDRITVAIVDHAHLSVFSQLRFFMERYRSALKRLGNKLTLLVVVGSEARRYRYSRLTKHPDFIKQFGGVLPISCFRVRGVPEISSLICHPKRPESDFLAIPREVTQPEPEQPPQFSIIKSEY
jgi:hypothetical protein